MKDDINKIICKKCGVAAGYFKIIHYHGVGEYRFFDDGTTEVMGKEDHGRPSTVVDNGDFYTGAIWREGKTKYCNNCKSRLASQKQPFKTR